MALSVCAIFSTCRICPTTHDDIVNGFGYTHEGRFCRAGALYRAAYRLFSGTSVPLYGDGLPVISRNHVLFTNYQFYVSEFEAYARADAGRSG